MNFKVLNKCFMICLLAVCWVACTDNSSCHSPNGKIGLEYAESPSGQPSFMVTCLDTAGREHRVIDISQVGVDCNALKGNGLRLKSVAGPQRISESYTMLTGKNGIAATRLPSIFIPLPTRWAVSLESGSVCTTPE